MIRLPLTANDELVKLRVSLARIAQAADCGAHIPGCSADAGFAELTQAAIDHERGWHRLAAFIVDRIHELKHS